MFVLKIGIDNYCYSVGIYIFIALEFAEEEHGNERIASAT